MISYIAHDKKSGVVFTGGLNQLSMLLMSWITDKAANAVMVIIKCRPYGDGVVIAEFSIKGGRFVTGGRIVPRRDLMKLSSRSSNGKAR